MDNNIVSSQRYVGADNAKGFLIFFVVLGHVLQRELGSSFLAPRVQLWIYLFHMPAFIFLAGMFSKKTVQKRRFEKPFSYLLLYVFMKVLFYASGVYINGAESTEFKLFNENGIPWFCLSMFWWLLLVTLLKDRAPRTVLAVAILAAVLVGHTSWDSSYLAVLRTINFFPCFYLGYLTDPDTLFSECQKRKVQFVGACVLLISFLIVLFFYSNKNDIKLFRGVYLYKEMGETFLGTSGGCARFIAFVLSLVLLLSLLAVCSIHNTVFAYVGRHTLQVFVFHGPIIDILFDKTDIIHNTLFPDNSFVQAFVISLLILFITLLPPFHHVVHHIMAIPGRLAGIIHNKK